MKINTSLPISEFQSRFNAKFPGLRVSFYDKAHQEKEGSEATSQYATDVVLKEVMKKKVDTIEFDLSPDQAVGDFEQMLEKEFGLHVQVFRRSNTLWLQTSNTDDWSLEKQNLKGLHSVQG